MNAATCRAGTARVSPGEDAELSLDGFDARLAERTRVSMSGEFELCTLTPAELAGQARSARCLLERLALVVAAAHDNAGVARGFLDRLDPKCISRDHDWRDVFRALAVSRQGGERYLLVALARYRQYLESRESVVQRLLAERGHLQGAGEPQPPAPREPVLDRLPARRAVLVSLVYRGELALWLAGHRFRLCDGFPPVLRDPAAENAWPLQRRALLVGRHADNDIVVDARLDQVSREHAVLEWRGSTGVVVTDLSSGGTYVERHASGGHPRPPSTALR